MWLRFSQCWSYFEYLPMLRNDFLFLIYSKWISDLSLAQSFYIFIRLTASDLMSWATLKKKIIWWPFEQYIFNTFMIIDFTNYRISSYKTLPQIIPAFLIMATPGLLLCTWILVISNNTCSWRPYKKIIPAGLIWGNTVIVHRLEIDTF